MLNWLKKRKQKAIVFVDYEHWFYSYKNIWGFKPNVTMWRKALEQKYKVVYLEFFADFSNPAISEEKAYLETVADRVYDTQDELIRRNKDMTDFVMLDHIYRSAIKYRNIPNYVLFTGEGNFKKVMKFLKDRRKNVISYGVTGAYSGMLREAACETVTVPNDEEIYLHYRDYIIDNLAYVVDNGKIIPTFNGTIDTVSEKHGLQPQAVKKVLIRLIEEGYIYQRPHSFGIGKTVKRLAANWDRLIAEGLFLVQDT